MPLDAENDVFPKHIVIRSSVTRTLLGRQEREVRGLGPRGGYALQFMKFYLKGMAFLCPSSEGFYGFSGLPILAFFLFLVITWKCKSQYISRSTSWKYEHLKLQVCGKCSKFKWQLIVLLKLFY